MKKQFLLYLLVLLLVLSGCSQEAPVTTEAPTIATEVPTEAPTEIPTEPPTEAPTEPPHSELYIPGVSADQVVQYFNEVCLNAEFVNSGDPRFLQRWNAPISYTLFGQPTEEDAAKIAEFAQWLNTIQGFPGMYEAGPEDYTNLRIYFRNQQGMIDIMGDQFWDMDGAVTFWYNDDIIYDAQICVRTDLDQYLRNSVILEEIYNGLGPIQDTDLRPDSIIYSAFSQPQALTEMDELILKLLYHPSLACGMNAAECEAAIRALYY